KQTMNNKRVTNNKRTNDSFCSFHFYFCFMYLSKEERHRLFRTKLDERQEHIARLFVSEYIYNAQIFNSSFSYLLQINVGSCFICHSFIIHMSFVVCSSFVRHLFVVCLLFVCRLFVVCPSFVVCLFVEWFSSFGVCCSFVRCPYAFPSYTHQAQVHIEQN